MTRKTEMLAQFLGYRLASEGFSIKELVSSAGLTKKEWENMTDEIDVQNLSEEQKAEITKYLYGDDKNEKSKI